MGRELSSAYGLPRPRASTTVSDHRCDICTASSGCNALTPFSLLGHLPLFLGSHLNHHFPTENFLEP